jgi:hypothetical protein
VAVISQAYAPHMLSLYSAYIRARKVRVSPELARGLGSGVRVRVSPGVLRLLRYTVLVGVRLELARHLASVVT